MQFALASALIIWLFRLSDTVGDFILKRLSVWGVHRVYGYPGDGINDTIGALERPQGVWNSSRSVMKRWLASGIRAGGGTGQGG
jgi:hypothetical protein